MIYKEKNLLRKWLVEKEYLTLFDIPKIESFGNKYFHNTKPLYSTYEALLQDETIRNDTIDSVPAIAKKEDGTRILHISEDDEIILTDENMKELLSGILDIQEQILPLGTVVDLNKDIFAREIPQIRDMEFLRVVITHRFLAYLDNVYYPYAGVIYPIGMLGRTEFLHFSYSMIDNVVHKGFSDESEFEYVIAMKNELIINRKMHSVGFAGEHELSRLAEILRGEPNG